ncbi:60S ribosomal protein L9-2-like [Manihot esculenta]|uniref:60S ribosomal protein L9-2-like n=1 Tax=Manihot esculenta TaxID=3983 RepID=UPI001CC550D4|nr:60S ribosomal protein L9-2-like [Manihot esculenta]
MKTILSSETMDIPDGVKIKINAKVIEVEGPRALEGHLQHQNENWRSVGDGLRMKIPKNANSRWKLGSAPGRPALPSVLPSAELRISSPVSPKVTATKLRFVYAHFPSTPPLLTPTLPLRFGTSLVRRGYLSFILFLLLQSQYASKCLSV